MGPGTLLGTIAGFALFVLLALLYFIGFVFWFQDYPRGGNFAGAVAFAAVTALAVASLGIALGAWFADRERAFQVLLATSVPFLFMSGIVFPREAMPVPINVLAMLVPTTPGIFGFVKLNQMGATWSEIRPELLNMTALLPLYGGAAWWAVRERRQEANDNDARISTQKNRQSGHIAGRPADYDARWRSGIGAAVGNRRGEVTRRDDRGVMVTKRKRRYGQVLSRGSTLYRGSALHSA